MAGVRGGGGQEVVDGGDRQGGPSLEGRRGVKVKEDLLSFVWILKGLVHVGRCFQLEVHCLGQRSQFGYL